MHGKKFMSSISNGSIHKGHYNNNGLWRLRYIRVLQILDLNYSETISEVTWEKYYSNKKYFNVLVFKKKNCQNSIDNWLHLKLVRYQFLISYLNILIFILNHHRAHNNWTKNKLRKHKWILKRHDKNICQIFI